MFEHATPTFFTAFFAGLLSFVSPCVLPLIPGYLRTFPGVTLDDMQGTGGAGAAAIAESRRPRRHRVALLRAGIFGRVRVAGRRRQRDRSVPAGKRLRLLGKIAGAVVFVFGLHTMGLLRIDWLYSEKRVQVERKPAASVARFLSVSRSRSAGRRASAPSSPVFWRSPARRKPSGRASGCWRSTRWGLASRSC